MLIIIRKSSFFDHAYQPQSKQPDRFDLQASMYISTLDNPASLPTMLAGSFPIVSGYWIVPLTLRTALRLFLASVTTTCASSPHSLRSLSTSVTTTNASYSQRVSNPTSLRFGDNSTCASNFVPICRDSFLASVIRFCRSEILSVLWPPIFAGVRWKRQKVPFPHFC